MLYHLLLVSKLSEDIGLDLRGECKAKGLVAESCPRLLTAIQ